MATKNNKNQLNIELISVVDSSNKKVISSVIKSRLGVANPSNLEYIILDKTTIIAVNKEELIKNKDFLNKVFYSLIKNWDSLSSDSQNGVFIFETNGLFNTFSIIDEKVNIEFKGVELELAVLLSIYENFKSKNVKFFYEEQQLIKNEIESLSSMLDLDAHFFHAFTIEENFNLDTHLNKFSEMPLESIMKKFTEMKNKKTKDSNSEEEEEKGPSALKQFWKERKILIVVGILVVFLAGLGFFGYQKYQEIQQKEQDRLDMIELQKKVKINNNSVLIKKMNRNQAFINDINYLLNNNKFSMLKVDNTKIQVNSSISKAELENNTNKFDFYQKVKIGKDTFLEIIHSTVNVPKITNLTKEEVMQIKANEKDLKDILLFNFQDLIVKETLPKGISIIKEYNSMNELSKDIDSLKNLNSHEFQFTIYKKSRNKFELFILFLK